VYKTDYMLQAPTLKFLKSLAKNNDKVWFDEHKSEYQQAKEDYESVVQQILDGLSKQDPAIAGLQVKDCTFRIYKDVRFSKDKTPYKTNMGAGFSPNGKLVQEPGYYLHIEPGNKSFVAGGIYMPDAPNLSKIRQEIDYNGDKLEKIMKDKKFKKWFKDLDTIDKLKTMPKGYSADNPRIELLKHKSYIVSYPFTDTQVKDKKFLKNIIEVMKAIRPLNEFLKEAIA